MTDWKMVPVEPTEKMLDVMHARVLISVDSKKREANILNDKAWWKAVVEASPVPPAGDVEVLGYSVKGNRYAIRLTKGELLELYEGYTGDALVELVDRAHIDRITAEIDKLKAENERYRNALRRVFKSTDGAFMVDGKWMVNGPVMDMVERTLYVNADPQDTDG